MGPFARLCDQVAVLWDEAQDAPRLLRFLAPFGRPHLPSIVAALKEHDARWLTTEHKPELATWLATLLAREGEQAPVKAERLVAPHQPTLLGALTLTGPLEVPRGHTLIICGALNAASIRCEGTLIVAGDVSARIVIADGCVLFGGNLVAQVLAVPLSTLGARSTFARVNHACLVAGEAMLSVLDSPRVAFSSLRVDVVARGAGLPSSPDWLAQARAKTGLDLRAEKGGLDLAHLSATCSAPTI